MGRRDQRERKRKHAAETCQRLDGFLKRPPPKLSDRDDSGAVSLNSTQQIESTEPSCDLRVADEDQLQLATPEGAIFHSSLESQ
jgi:hypothetical protein